MKMILDLSCAEKPTWWRDHWPDIIPILPGNHLLDVDVDTHEIDSFFYSELIDATIHFNSHIPDNCKHIPMGFNLSQLVSGTKIIIK